MQIFSKELLFAADDLHGVKEYKTYGTYTFKLSRRTKVKITIVGSGQDCSKMVLYSTSYLGGFGGGFFVGQAYLPSGTYNVVINESVETVNQTTGDTFATTGDVTLSNSFGTLINVAKNISKSSNFEYIPGTIEHEDEGTGDIFSGKGGASPYMGYGKGSDAKVHNQTSGYFKIEW